MATNTNIRWLSAVGIVIAVCATVWRCNDADWLGNKPPPPVALNKADTVTLVDTVYMRDTVEIEVESKPFLVLKEDEPDTVVVYSQISPDTLRIVKDFFKKRNFKDTVYRGPYGGYVTVSDVIFQNSLASRSVKQNIRYPGVITRTITVKDTVEILGVSKSRTVAYLGGFVAAAPLAIGVSFGTTLPSDVYVGMMAAQYWKQTPVIGLELKLPIKFKKR